jgi:CRISPR-associated exonuclease Cas4
VIGVRFELVLLLIGLVLLALAWWLRRGTGVPWAPLHYDDASGWQRLPRPLVSQRYGLVGKPDYVIQTRHGLIPIEAKPTRTASAPYASDVAQLLAYCLLIEETIGQPPPYGLLRYAHQTFRLPYTAARRTELLHLLQAMRADAYADDVPRSHEQPQRCRNCSVGDQCDDRIG